MADGRYNPAGDQGDILARQGYSLKKAVFRMGGDLLEIIVTDPTHPVQTPARTHYRQLWGVPCR